MKARDTHALRRAACLCTFGFAIVGGPTAHAQSSLAPPPPAGYQDRLISGGTLAPDISSGDYLDSSDPTGLTRSVRIDAVASVLSQQGANATPTVHENGIVADAQWETRAYGAWSADAGVRIGGGDERFTVSGNDNPSFSLHQRGMPFDGGWQADNGLGDLNAPLIGLARTQPRFLLSSGSMLGAETEWRVPSGLQIVAGGGELGIYNGIRVLTFETLGGSTGTLGAQWSPSPQWIIGGEYAGARDANIYFQPPGSALLPAEVANQRISSNTGLVSAAWQDGAIHAQFNFIDGTLDGNNNAQTDGLEVIATLLLVLPILAGQLPKALASRRIAMRSSCLASIWMCVATTLSSARSTIRRRHVATADPLAKPGAVNAPSSTPSRVLAESRRRPSRSSGARRPIRAGCGTRLQSRSRSRRT